MLGERSMFKILIREGLLLILDLTDIFQGD